MTSLDRERVIPPGTFQVNEAPLALAELEVLEARERE